MRFWDASALLPLLVVQPQTRVVRELHRSDDRVMAWILTDMECHAAMCRLARENRLSHPDLTSAVDRLKILWESVDVITAVSAVKARARRLLSLHPLAATDALQLGAALVAVQDQAAEVEFACVDPVLAAAALREGFRVVP
jgi:predicted nucleic acid-binding protein